jgi:hypothetical protein
VKRPQPDIGDILRSSFTNNIRTVRKLKKLWGTSTVGGVEVFTPRQYYYPTSARSAEFEELFKFLGAYDGVVNSSPKGIESAWMYFNKNNVADLSGEYSEFVASNLNQLWWDDADGVMPTGLTLTTTIVIEAEVTSKANRTVRSTSLLSPSSTNLIADIEANYEAMWDTCVITQQGIGVINKGSTTDPVTTLTTMDEDDLSPDDPWLDVISKYALRDVGIPCTIKSVELGVGVEEGVTYTTYIVTLEIPYNLFSSGAVFVESITDDLDTVFSPTLHTRLSYPNRHWTRKSIRSMDVSDLSDGTVITRPYRLWESEATDVSLLYTTLWYNYSGSWYLRAEPFSDPRSHNLTFKQLSTYIVQMVDSGYKKKKVSWWKKLIAIVVFVLLVIYAPGGTKGALALLKAVAYASAVLSLITVALSLVGADEWASAFAEVSKDIEPLTRVASMVTLVNGLGNMAKNFAEGLDSGSLTDMLSGELDSFIDNIIEGATDIMAGNLISDPAISLATKLVNLLSMPTKLKIASLNDRNRDLKSEYEGMAEEMGREYDALRGFMDIYARPATADWSMYASTYDLPYERGGGTMAIGNIQRTTKQALRKADYSDPMFENILVV